MKWILFKTRKPQQSGSYYWKGKSNYGGKALYYEDTQTFDFDDSIPVNKIGEDVLYWLDEENATYDDGDKIDVAAAIWWDRLPSLKKELFESKYGIINNQKINEIYKIHTHCSIENEDDATEPNNVNTIY